MSIKTYTELNRLLTFKERFQYLKLNGNVGEDTFGFDRYLNQKFYNSAEWKRIRNFVIVRDNGCDMGLDDYPINGLILIHHINPVRSVDIQVFNEDLLNPEYLVSVSHLTHNAIHYGDENLLPKAPIERIRNDTCPWRK